MAEGRFQNIANAAKGIMNLSIAKQLVLFGILAVSLALGYSVVSWLYQTNYRPLYTNLDNKDIAAIADVLQKNNIDFKVSDRDGAVLVAVDQLKQAKIKLIGSGYNENSIFGFAEFDKESGVGTSRFLENIRYVRALEGEMARTIMAIQGIKVARVHLALPKSSVFVSENEKPTASVLVELLPGKELDKSQVNAIVQLVAGSVSGMKATDVNITDQHGRLLSDHNNEFALSEEQLNYQKEMQEYYEKRIQTMIAPLMGPDKVEVRVFANIDFTHEEKTKEEFSPNDKSLRSEQSLTEQNSGGGSGGTPGALSNQPPESGGAAPAGAGGSAGNSKNQSIKNYEVSKSLSYSRSSQGKLLNLSVALVVDNEKIIDPKTKKETSTPVSSEKIQKINELVKAAIGFDDKRGDKVSVINSPFVVPQAIEPPPSIPFYKEDWFWDMAEKVGAVLVTLLIFFGVIKPLINSFATSSPSAVENTEQGEKVVLSPEMQKLKQQQLESLKQLAQSEPTKVAGVLKSWVGTKE